MKFPTRVAAIFLLILVIGTGLIYISFGDKIITLVQMAGPQCTPYPGNPPVSCRYLSTLADFPVTYQYEILRTLPHDPGAYTQGLILHDGYFYESTGLKGQSTLRMVDPATGVIEKLFSLSPEDFGEGLAVIGDRLYQLTWLQKTGYIYDLATFELVGNFSYDTPGWGLTFDGQYLILSDGTEVLYFLNPDNFSIARIIIVHDGSTPLPQLNELEYVDGKIYANIWHDTRIAQIDALSGRVTGWIELAALVSEQQLGREEALNGIAFDPETDTMYITGKNWPTMYQIRIK